MDQLTSINLKTITTMTQTTVKIMTIEQQRSEGPGIDLAQTDYADLTEVILLESATGAGKTGAMLVFKTKDGKTFAALTTGAMLDTIGGAARGTIARFGK